MQNKTEDLLQEDGKKKKKNRNEWQVLLFDFQITQASILLTWRVNKYRIQFPWSHAISWQSSKRSNRLLQGTWATVKKRKEKKKKALGIWKVLTPWASHKKRQMSNPQKQLLGEALVFKPAVSQLHPTTPHSGCQSEPEERWSIFVAVLNTYFNCPGSLLHNVLPLVLCVQKITFFHKDKLNLCLCSCKDSLHPPFLLVSLSSDCRVPLWPHLRR